MNPEARLTKREIEVIRAFKDGSDYKEVAEKLGITPSTVNMHNTHSFKKMVVKNIREAMFFIETYHKGE